MIGRGCAALAFALAGIAAGAVQQPARDSAAAPAGTATISGTILVQGTPKQPARRVRVTLNEAAHAVPGQTTTTDDAGAFAFRGVPAGRYELKAAKSAYLTASYGASRPERPGTPIVVKDGEQITNIVVTIARGGVITGVVHNGRGRALSGVTVGVMRFGYNAVTGERTLVRSSLGGSSTTDDRGEYRAYGLPPGTYLVLAAPATEVGRAGIPSVDDIRPLTGAEVDRALQAARSGSSAPGVASTPSLSSPAPRVNYAPVFHPGVTDIAAAVPIALGLSEERGGADITIQYLTTATVSGTVSLPGSSVPPIVQVRLVPAGAQADLLAGAGLRGLTARPAADGSYAFGGVAPGNYTIKATTSQGGRGVAPTVPALWAAADVTVGGENLTVPLTLQPGVTLNGRVVFEGSQPTPTELQTLSFKLIPSGSGGQPAYLPGGQVNAEGRFTFTGVTPDSYQFVTQWSGGSGRWAIKSSSANGRESFDAPLRVNPNETLEWTITYTDKPTGVGGTLQDRAGRAATDYSILVFSADRKYWTPGSRRIRTMRPATDGVFSAMGLPPGEYFLVALTDLEPGEWNDPALLEQLGGRAVTVTLRDGEMTTQDLRIGG